MRKSDASLEELLAADYQVAVTKASPRSEEHVPLRLILGGLTQPPTVGEAVSSRAPGTVEPLLPTDIGAMLSRIDALEQYVANLAVPRAMTIPAELDARLAAMEKRIVELATEGMRMDPASMPAFLGGSSAPMDDDDIPDPRDLATRVDMISRRMDGLADTVSGLTAPSAAVAPPPAPEPELVATTLPEIKDAAVRAVAEAAKRRRGEVIGWDVDDRDMLMRMTGMAYRAKAGNPPSQDMLSAIADQSGMPWSDLADQYTGLYEAGDRITARTVALEVSAIADINDERVSTAEAVARIRDQFVDAIGNVTGEPDDASTSQP